MVELSCKDIGVQGCDFVARAKKPRTVQNAMFEHIFSVHPQLVAGLGSDQRDELDRRITTRVHRVGTSGTWNEATLEEATMEASVQDYVGFELFDRDGAKIGKIKGVIHSADSVSECLVVKCGAFRDVVIPADIVTRPNPHAAYGELPFSRKFMDNAPKVSSKDRISDDEVARLEQFYHSSSA